MSLNETKGVITKTISLKNNFKSASQSKIPELPVFGGTFSDVGLAWLYNGPILKITDITDGSIVSLWDFTIVTRDNRAKIVDLIEYSVTEPSSRVSKENQMYFIVAYTSKKDSNKASYLSVCHPRTSQILHTITTKEKVTCVTLISAKKDHSSPVTGIMKHMSGSLAVGTKGGNILIVDIKEMLTSVRRSSFERVQNRSSELLILDFKHDSENAIKERLDGADKYHHIAISLSVLDREYEPCYNFEVTAMKYLPQCTMLAVGFKNGVFQLWSISEMKKLYRSSQPGDPTSVVKFGFQEPCNDPQSICYLWVLYQADNERDSSCLPFAIMYGCLFKKVANIPDYGRHYKGFMHCKKRFDIDVDLERCVNGRCIACNVVSNTQSNILRHVTSVEEDVSKINLFVIAFETWERVMEFNSFITLVVFDMNQWYKAQMPPQVYQTYSVPFVNFQILDHISERKCSVLDMRIKKDSLQQFLSFNLSEEYSYPSSLSLDTVFLTDSKVVHVHIPGAQKNVLEKIVAEGPSGVINPSKFYSECKVVGLRPCFWDSYTHLAVCSQLQQRNYILTVLLEHKLSSFLVCCVKQWSDGSRGVSGCTLPNLIQWAWDCITRIKQLTDTICIPLFDYSGDDLDRENYQKLKHCVQLMHTIRDLLAFILKNYKQYLLDDTKLMHQVDTLKLVTRYFDIIIWCLDSNLLPEKVISSSEMCVPTYMMSIMQYTDQRRAELKSIIMKDKYFSTENTNLYIIDAILEGEPNAAKMCRQWERESGGISNGLYCPVTLQSLLRMFLMADISIDAKHFIMTYFLLDVCDYHRDEDMKEQLMSFSVVFSIETSFFLLVQACWFIDHEKFEEAAGLLLIDSVITQFKNRKHLYRTLLLACVCQGQYSLALRCERLTKLSCSVFKDDIFYISLLLLNGLVMEAYTTLKNNSCSRKELLRHFFKVCDNLGYLKELFKFPLTPEEEEEFIGYLDGCNNKDAGDIKVMYLLSRARYVEAIDVNHKLSSTVPKYSIVGQDTTKQSNGVGRTTTRDLLVNAFSKTLPSITNDLINFYRTERTKISRFKAVDKPTPLSVIVHTDTSQQIPMYRSSFESVLEAAIRKTAETWSNVPEIFKSKRAGPNLKNTPFLRSDIMTPRKTTSIFRERETPGMPEKPRDADEPPAKKARTNMSAIVDDFNEVEATEKSHSLPPAEVTKILCTPHVQKRLNKLLQSTPESSPLTSILKSSESKFKQPQKVGFSVPERDDKRSERKRVSLNALMTEEKDAERVKKCLDFVPSPGPDITSAAIPAAIPENDAQNISLNTSLDTSVAVDSYYSLDSDTESPNISDFIQESAVAAAAETLSSTPKPVYMESMSEEEALETHPRQMTIESMSEEETPEKPQITKPTDVVAEEPLANVSLIEPSLQLPAFQISKVRSVSKSIPFSSIEDPILLFDQPENEVEKEDENKLTVDQTMSFASLQPSHEFSMTVESGYQPADQENDMWPEPELDLQPTNFREEFSLDTYENETINEDEDDITAAPTPPLEPSVTDVKDSSSEEEGEEEEEEDSDIEIVGSETRSVDDEMDDKTTVENSDISENTFDSEYSDSQGSAEARGEFQGEEIDEDSAQEEESSIEVESENEGEEISTEGEEEEEEEDDYEKIEEDEDTTDEREEAEDEAEGKEEVEVPSAAEQEQIESNIDYDMLRKIMSTVQGAKAGEEPINVKENEIEVVKDESSLDIEKQQDTSVKVLSLSSVEKEDDEKETSSGEPAMVFYFGENSVTSIGEELLGDESMEQQQQQHSESGKMGDDVATNEESPPPPPGNVASDLTAQESCFNLSQFDYSIYTVNDNVVQDVSLGQQMPVESLDSGMESNCMYVEESFSRTVEVLGAEDVSSNSNIVALDQTYEVEEVFESKPEEPTDETELVALDYSTSPAQDSSKLMAPSDLPTDEAPSQLTPEVSPSRLIESHYSSSSSRKTPPILGSPIRAQQPTSTRSPSQVSWTPSATQTSSFASDLSCKPSLVTTPISTEQQSFFDTISSSPPKGTTTSLGSPTQQPQPVLIEQSRSPVRRLNSPQKSPIASLESSPRAPSMSSDSPRITSLNQSPKRTPTVSVESSPRAPSMSPDSPRSTSLNQSPKRTPIPSLESSPKAPSMSPGSPRTTSLNQSPKRTPTVSVESSPKAPSMSPGSPKPTSSRRSPTLTLKSPLCSPVKPISPLARESPQPHDQTIVTEVHLPLTDEQTAANEMADGAPSTAPVQKAESVCSFTLSVPSSPTAAVADNIEIVFEPPSTPPPEPAVVMPDTPSSVSRRSARIARRRSIESLPSAVPSEPASVLSRLSRKRKNSDAVSEATGESDYDDDASSVKSGVSVTDSVTSRASSMESGISAASSTRRSLQNRKRSFSRLEMRKSSVKPQFRQLEVIMSDEEFESPTKSEAGHVEVAAGKSGYAASDPGGSRKSTTISRSDQGDGSEDEDRLSSVSESTGSRNAATRPRKSKLNTAVVETPNKSKKGGSRRFVCSTPMASDKTDTKKSESTTAVEDYSGSRRITRYQKSLLEYGITRAAQSEEAAASQPNSPHLSTTVVDQEEENTNSDEEHDNTVIAVKSLSKNETPMKKPSTRVASKKKNFACDGPPDSGLIIDRHIRDLMKRNDTPLPAGSPESSDESFSSKASTASRCSQRRRSTYTNLELRKSSVRPQFKPLAVIQSDEESLSRTPSKLSIADDESLNSSIQSNQSQRSTRRSTRLMKNEAEHSDKESSVSDASNYSNSMITTRKTRRSLALSDVSVGTSSGKRQAISPAVSEKQTTTKRATRGRNSIAATEPGVQQRSSKKKK